MCSLDDDDDNDDDDGDDGAVTDADADTDGDSASFFHSSGSSSITSHSSKLNSEATVVNVELEPDELSEPVRRCPLFVLDFVAADGDEAPVPAVFLSRFANRRACEHLSLASNELSSSHPPSLELYLRKRAFWLPN